MTQKITKFKSEQDLRVMLAGEYRKQIENFFGDEKETLKFLSGVVAAVQRTPALLECQPATLINSFIIMAQLKFMPSAVSGEAYVLPYENKKRGITEAQFQLGYQGLVTLLYRAGTKQVIAELVRQNDIFRIVNGSVHHEVDPFKTREERGKVIGAYAIITTASGGKLERFMRTDEILAHAQKFSKSFASSFSPWNAENDPEGWMLRKTVLKQAAKLAPKNETLNYAIAEDNKDSIIGDRLEEAKKKSGGLAMGALLAENKKNENENEEEAEEAGDDAESDGEQTEKR